MESAGEKLEGSHNASPIINHALKSEVAITLHLKLCSTHYTALQTSKKLLCNESTLLQKKPVGSNFVLSQIDTYVVSKKNWNKVRQR